MGVFVYIYIYIYITIYDIPTYTPTCFKLNGLEINMVFTF